MFTVQNIYYYQSYSIFDVMPPKIYITVIVRAQCLKIVYKMIVSLKQ